MALNKIKKANKKFKRERARRQHRAGLIQRKEQQKRIIERNKRRLVTRRSELSYVDQLTQEVLNDK